MYNIGDFVWKHVKNSVCILCAKCPLGTLLNVCSMVNAKSCHLLGHRPNIAGSLVIRHCLEKMIHALRDLTHSRLK